MLDDPLAAVDAHVGQHLFDQCIMGLLDQRKCVVLVTNALHFIREATDIVVLDNGCVIEHGNFEELIAQKGNFCDMINTHAEGMTAADTARGPCVVIEESLLDISEEDAPMQSVSTVLVDVHEGEDDVVADEARTSSNAITAPKAGRHRSASLSSVGSASSSSKYTREQAEKAKKELEEKEKGRLINKEDREVSHTYNSTGLIT